MAFPGGPLPSPPRQEEKHLPPEIDGRASYRGFVGKRVFIVVFVVLVFCSRMVSTLSCIGPGSPRPCMSRRPGNPRHLNVDPIRASALLGPVSVPPHGWPEPTPAPRWSRPPQTKPHAPNPSPQPSHKKSAGREPMKARGRGFLVYHPSAPDI